MGGPLLGRGGAGVVSGDLDVSLAVCDRHANLVVTPTRQEIRVGVGEGNLSQKGQACCGADDVALGDADVDEPLRVGIAEPDRVVGCCAVPIEDEYVVVLGSQFQQGLRVSIARFFHRGHRSSSNASSSSSSVGARP